MTFVLCDEQGDFVLAGIRLHLIKLQAASLIVSTVNRYIYIKRERERELSLATCKSMYIPVREHGAIKT